VPRSSKYCGAFVMNISVNVILYGDYMQLAGRCLGSIRDSLPNSDFRAYVKDVRIGLNDASYSTTLYAVEWANRLLEKTGTRTVIYCCRWGDRPSLKYPVQRLMFHDPVAPQGEHVMWFDDDSYLITEQEFWWKIRDSFLKNRWDVLGRTYTNPHVNEGQRQWVIAQDWHDPDVKTLTKLSPKTYTCKFTQGAWFVARRELLEKMDWPIPELKHCGGDTMFGIATKHYKAQVGDLDCMRYVQQNTSTRRGYTEKDFARDYVGEPMPTDHHDFEYKRIVVE
jgi:hypothetical protein